MKYEIGLTFYNPCLQLMLRVTRSHLVTLGWAGTQDTENLRNEYRTYDQCVARISVPSEPLTIQYPNILYCVYHFNRIYIFSFLRQKLPTWSMAETIWRPNLDLMGYKGFHHSARYLITIRPTHCSVKIILFKSW